MGSACLDCQLGAGIPELSVACTIIIMLVHLVKCYSVTLTCLTDQRKHTLTLLSSHLV